MPRISVIIPTYNCAGYVAETLDSILAQTFQDIEVIVVDDGSTDSTRAIVAGYAPRVQLIEQENGGVCRARNRGIAAARGNFICLMDHDDYWYPDKLQLQLELFERQPDVGVVYGSYRHWYRNQEGTFPSPQEYAKQEAGAIDEEYSGWIYHLLLLDCVMLTSTSMFRREVFDRCGVFDESLPYSEDWDLWLRLSREYQFLKLHNLTTLYRQHPKQENRVNRPIDYRTRLLLDAVGRWGLCSPDGKCQSLRVFKRQIARFHAEFGFAHLKDNNLKTAFKSFLSAWLADPLKVKYLGYIPGALLGWRPSW
jgi:glycosyltransferase involved in cell wall biosynthesis